MIIALYLAVVIHNGALFGMELPENPPIQNASKPTDDQVATAAWTYNLSLINHKQNTFSDDDITTMVTRACATAKFSTYDGIADDLASKYAHWSDIISAVHTVNPKQILIPQKKPYNMAPEVGIAIVDSSEKITHYFPSFLALQQIHSKKNDYTLPGKYWPWNKASRPIISPNGKFCAALCYSEKEYAVIDLASRKETLLPSATVLGLCLTNSFLYAVTDTGFHEKPLPLTESPVFSQKALYTYKKPVSKSQNQHLISASSDETAFVVHSDEKMAWFHRKIEGIFFTEEVALSHHASAYFFIAVSRDCIIGINRNAWYNQANQHFIGYRPEDQPYDHDGLITRSFKHQSVGSGAVSPDKKLLALESLEGNIALFVLQKNALPTLSFTIKNAGSLLCWANTLGQPIICYGSQKNKKKSKGIILLYPCAGYYTLERYKTISLRTPH